MKILKHSRARLPRLIRLFVLGLAAPVWLAICFQAGLAQGDEVAPNANLEVSGIPKVPAALAQAVKRYTSPYGLPLAGWDPAKREIWLKGISSATWIARVETPGGKQQTTTYIQASGVYDLYYQPQAKYLVYNRDANGNEVFQFFLYDLATRKNTPLTDGKTRDTEPVWSNAGDQIVYSSSPASGNGVSLYLINPLDPKSNHLVVNSTGSYLKAYDWSPDDRQVAFCDFVSNRASTLWLLDMKTGEKTLVSPKGEKENAYYVDPQFGKDGKGIYVITDRDSEVRRLAYLDLATKRMKYLSDEIKFDVNEFQIAPDGKTIAFITNEDGVSRLYLLDTGTSRRTPIAGLPIGIVSDLKWHNNSTDLAFNFKSPRTPNDVYSLDAKTGKIECWAKSITNGVDTESFQLPELIKWKSFDGRMISGFLYRPPSKFIGKRPVIIDIHGGPKEQYRPGFGYEHNYILNELGIAKIYPNVRGSLGFGKTFLNLDDGLKREDAVKDIGALLDWIKAQPDLDASRVMVQGGSYGGYLALSVAVNYNDRIRAAISDCGMSNLASFLDHTDGWTRDLQRGEFGDERDPKIRAFLEKIAPLNHAEKIKTPLLIIQGKNDPRVPAAESEAVLQAAKKNGVQVWHLLAKDEGHGFAKRANWEFRLYSIILFAQAHLLRQV
jgi:dipeptidyl aminopeptidase/acylaminoacyl peptidase